jgi:hypothetical protein
MERKIERIETQLTIQGQRTDQLYQMYLEQTSNHTARTDQLYQMYLDILKEQRK